MRTTQSRRTVNTAATDDDGTVSARELRAARDEAIIPEPSVDRARVGLAGQIVQLQHTAGNRAATQLVQLQRAGGKALGKGIKRGTVLVLGRFDGPIRHLLERAARATGLRPVLMSELESTSELLDIFFPSGLFSGSVVHEALEGGGLQDVRAIYLDTEGVDLLRGGPLYQKSPTFHGANLGGQTAAEYRNVVAAVAAKNHQVDIFIRHKGGVSVIKAGSHTVQGAPLPDVLRPHLPESMFGRRPPTGGADGGAPRFAPPKGGPRFGGRSLGRAALEISLLGAQLAMDLVLSHFAGKLARENAEQLRSAWNDKVGRHLEQRLRTRLPELERERPSRCIYLTATWYVLNEEMSNDLGDLVVLLWQEDFAEVFHDLSFDPKWDLKEFVGSPPSHPSPKLQRQRMWGEGGEKLRVRGPYVLDLLISDPEVWRLADAAERPGVVAGDLFDEYVRLSTEQRALLERISPRFSAASKAIEDTLRRAAKAIREYKAAHPPMAGEGYLESDTGQRHYY